MKRRISGRATTGRTTAASATFPSGSFAGRHELKTGAHHYFYTHGTGLLNNEHGNYELLYDRVLGVPNTAGRDHHQ